MKILTAGLCLLLAVSLQAAAYAGGSDEAPGSGTFFDTFHSGEEGAVPPGLDASNWAQAKRVHVFTPQEFLRALKQGTLEEAIASAPTIWRVPVSCGDSGYSYINAGASGYTTVYGSADTGNDAPYLFEPEIIPADIFDRGGAVYIVTVLENINADFIVALSEEGPRLVPYSTRPDFLKLENGRVYSSGEVAAALTELSRSMAWPDFGRGAAVIAVLLADGAVLAVWVKRRGRVD